ncbi:MAG: hypothetical protein GX410_04265 [Elusimicrobia bacterium]|nr:hypothetical protein [Elusimicrobiota bacterium]
MKKFICAAVLSCAALPASAADFNVKAINNSMSETQVSQPVLAVKDSGLTVKQAEAMLADGLPEGGYAYDVLATLFNKGAMPDKAELLGVYKGYSFSEDGKAFHTYLATVQYPDQGELFKDCVKIAPFKHLPKKNIEEWLSKKMEKNAFATPLKNTLKTVYPSLWDKEAELRVRKYGNYIITAGTARNFFGMPRGTMSYYYEKVSPAPAPAPAPQPAPQPQGK